MTAASKARAAAVRFFCVWSNGPVLGQKKTSYCGSTWGSAVCARVTRCRIGRVSEKPAADNRLKKPRESLRYLAEKREVARLASLRSDQRLDRSVPQRHPLKAAFAHQDRRVLERICKRNPYAHHRYDETEILKVPSNFSFIDNPHGTIDFLLRAAALVDSPRTQRVSIRHQDCTSISLAAEGMLGVVALLMQSRGKNIHGHVPDDPNLKRLVWAIGTPRILRVPRLYFSKEIREGEIRVLRYRSILLEGFADLRTADPKGRSIEKIITHIDGCLDGHGAQLSPSGKLLLVRYLGEIIGNAEEHAGMVDWTVMGYLDTKGDCAHTCELALFNFGDSIAETFLALPPADPAIQAITPYIDEHRSGGFFSPDWRVEDLLTVIALQGHVSCKLRTDPTRGNGSVEMMNVFKELSATSMGPRQEPQVVMSVVSGGTQILFDGRYQMRPDDSGRPVVAFNTQNDLRRPPDRSYVRSLGQLYLPATVISIRFPLLPEHLRSKEPDA